MESYENAANKILCGREERFSLQQEILSKYRLPMVVATVNYPGSSKNDSISQIVFNEMLYEIKAWTFLYTTQGVNGAGPFFIGIIEDLALNIKKKALQIEKYHRLGRLFDIDVIEFPYRKLSRLEGSDLARTCLICNRDYRICAREKAHSVAELQEKIRNMVEVYLLESCSQKKGRTN